MFLSGRKMCMQMLLLLLATYLSVSDSHAAIDLEFRPVNPVATVGSTVDMGLYAVSDSAANQLLSAVQVIFIWDPQYLDLLGNTNVGAAPMTFSGFPTTGHFGLNESTIPQDGDGFYLGLSFSAIAATPGGTLLTTLQFNAVQVVNRTTVGMLLQGGDGGQTIVASGSTPGQDVTGQLIGGSVQIIPAPAAAWVFIMGPCMLIWRRARR